MKETDALVSDLFFTSYSVINSLKSIDRTNYALSEYTKNIIAELKLNIDEYNGLSIDFYIASSEVPALIQADECVRIKLVVSFSLYSQKQFHFTIRFHLS